MLKKITWSLLILSLLLPSCTPKEVEPTLSDVNKVTLQANEDATAFTELTLKAPTVTFTPTNTLILTLTNTPTSTPSATPTNTPTIITYIVKNGDSCLSIASYFRITLASLFEMNPFLGECQQQNFFAGVELKILLPPPTPSPTP